MNKNLKTVFLLTTVLILLVGISCATAANSDNQTATKVKTTDTTKQVQTTTKTSTNTDTKKVDNKKTVNKTTTTKNVKTATKNNYTVTQKTYSTYFDSNSVAKTSTITNGSTLTFSGNIKNKDFTFDNIQLTVNNDGTNTLYNTTITVQNNAKITFDGLKINNNNKTQDYAVLLETSGNTIKNSDIKVVSSSPVQGIKIDDDKNTVTNTTVNITAPSSDVIYNADYSIGNAASSGIFIRGSSNLINNTKLYYTALDQTGYFPSVDGIDIQSKDVSETVVNNTISNSVITVNGVNYVYGLNMGRSKNTKMTSTTINVTSQYYADAIQLFDADTTTLSGTLYSQAENEAYGVYSTAMATGISQNIKLTKLNMNVEAPTATGVLLEGSSNATLTSSTYNIKGENASAVASSVDWMGNIPANIIIKKLNININTTGSKYVMGFYNSTNIKITDNTIKSNKGTQITFIITPKSSVKNNYIVIANKYLGNDAVTSDSSDTVIKNNTPSIAQLIKENENLKQTFATKITLNKITTNVGKKIKITANIKTKEGKNVTAGKLIFKVNGKYLKDSNGNIIRANVAKGVATIKYTVPNSWINSTNKLQALYYGKGKFNNSNVTKNNIIKVSKGSSKITVTPNATTTKAGNKIVLSIRHVDANSNRGLNSVVTVKINGKTLKAKIKNGSGTLTYTVPKGTDAKTYKITATHSSNYRKKSTSTATVKVTKTTPTIKTTKITYKNKKVTLKATLKDINGKLLTKNVKATIKVDGKTVTTKTIKKGTVSLSFTKSLGKGYHALSIISASTNAFNKATLTTAFKV